MKKKTKKSVNLKKNLNVFIVFNIIIYFLNNVTFQCEDHFSDESELISDE